MNSNATPWQAAVLTIFPQMFPGPLGLSLAGQGMKEDRWNLTTINIRKFAHGSNNSVDDCTFGGGPGMVMRPDVIDLAIKNSSERFSNLPLMFLTPRGKRIDQHRIRQLAEGPGVRLLCGRFEGVDQRVLEQNQIEEISLGDFVMSGGEVAALSILDACVRLLPGIINKVDSLIEESFENNLLEYPHYTRPQIWDGMVVPEVLLSGNHKKIQSWRQTEAENITKQRRPDLWEKYLKLRTNSIF